MNQDLSNNNFFHKVYQVTSQIPHGRVTTYGAIARYIGSPQSSRMVGWALNSTTRFTGWIPAHRVVNRNGMLTGKAHFPGSETMKELLESEGIRIEENRIMGFEKHFWDPINELGVSEI